MVRPVDAVAAATSVRSIASPRHGASRPTIEETAMAPTTTTTGAPRSTTGAAGALDRARRLTPEIHARAAETELARRLPPDLLDELVAAGCFRILLPCSHGGVEASLRDALELYATLAGADASTGWTVMIGATAWVDMTRLPRPTFDACFPPDADTIVAGAFAPTGSIVPADGAYELTGRWALVSGCEHATWILLNAMEDPTRMPPALRACVLDPADVSIEDTWRAAGLRGTGSHHVRVDGLEVPADRTLVPLVGPPCVDAPIAHVWAPAVFSLAIGAVAVGAGRGAIDDVLAVAGARVPFLSAEPVALDPHFHDGLARARTGLDAAWALVAEVAEALWTSARSGVPTSLDDRARARAAATWATQAAIAATEFAFTAGGASAIYDDSPLQRRLRDARAIAQHFLVRPGTFSDAGAVFAGHQPTVPIF
jgi:alkylation response protein AidB-like acyl-CoA dehydrogenase